MHGRKEGRKETHKKIKDSARTDFMEIQRGAKAEGGGGGGGGVEERKRPRCGETR